MCKVLRWQSSLDDLQDLREVWLNLYPDRHDQEPQSLESCRPLLLLLQTAQQVAHSVRQVLVCTVDGTAAMQKIKHMLYVGLCISCNTYVNRLGEFTGHLLHQNPRVSTQRPKSDGQDLFWFLAHKQWIIWCEEDGRWLLCEIQLDLGWQWNMNSSHL